MSTKKLQKDKKATQALIIFFILCLSLSVLPLRIIWGDASFVKLITSQVALFFICLVIWYLFFGMLQYKRIPYMGLRIFTGTIISGMASMVFYYIYIYIYGFQSFTIKEKMTFQFFVTLFTIGVCVAVIYLPLAFFIRQNHKLRQKEKEIVRLKQIHVEARIEKLKSKLSPHFLFNALTVLKSGTDDLWVKEYTVALSATYRYLTDHKINQTLISLQSELDFIDAYIYLLEARFGDQINIHISDDIRYMEGNIPPLTLQLLIENAVKHNVISIEKPLHIDILPEDNWITVRNHIAKKKLSDFTSGGTGLYNISERYLLIAGKNIFIDNDGEHFTVKIPVLSKNTCKRKQNIELF